MSAKNINLHAEVEAWKPNHNNPMMAVEDEIENFMCDHGILLRDDGRFMFHHPLDNEYCEFTDKDIVDLEAVLAPRVAESNSATNNV